MVHYVYDWILEKFRYTSLDFTVFELVHRILFNCILHLFHLIVFGFITLLGLDST